MTFLAEFVDLYKRCYVFFYASPISFGVAVVVAVLVVLGCLQVGNERRKELDR